MTNTTPTPGALDLDKLEALAHAATPGPWIFSKYGSVMDGEKIFEIVPADTMQEDRAYIAAANPAAVLGLIALARRAAQPADTERCKCGMTFGDCIVTSCENGADTRLRAAQPSEPTRQQISAAIKAADKLDVFADAEAVRAMWRAMGAQPSAEKAVEGELPPMPEPAFKRGKSYGVMLINSYDANQYRQGQRDAIAASRRAAMGKAMYQAQFDGEYGSSVWHDVTEAAYHTFVPKHRRIVYATPAPESAAQAGQVAMLHLKAARDAVRRVAADLGVLHEDKPVEMAATIAVTALLVSDDLDAGSKAIEAAIGALAAQQPSAPTNK